MTTELAIPEPMREIVQAGWWHEVAQPVIEGSDWGDLDGLDAQLKAYIAIFESLGREDKIELEKARRVVEKRRGELLGDPRIDRDQHGKFTSNGSPADLDRATQSRFRRLARCWPILEPHLLQATDIKEVRRSFLLELATTADEDPDVPKNGQPMKLPREKRAKQIADLAEKGHTAQQISDKLKVGRQTVQEIANEYGTTLPLARHHNTVDPNEVINRVVASLEADVSAIDLIRGTEESLDRSQIERWVNSLNESLSRLRKLTNQLKELTHAKD